MRLYEGIVIDVEATFGELRFCEMVKEVYTQDETGNITNELKRRKFNLKSCAQKYMIEVLIPAEAGEKKFDYNAKVELINPEIGVVANATFNGGATVDWFLKADDIVLKGHPVRPGQPQPGQNQPGQPKKD